MQPSMCMPCRVELPKLGDDSESCHLESEEKLACRRSISALKAWGSKHSAESRVWAGQAQTEGAGNSAPHGPACELKESHAACSSPNATSRRCYQCNRHNIAPRTPPPPPAANPCCLAGPRQAQRHASRTCSSQGGERGRRVNTAEAGARGQRVSCWALQATPSDHHRARAAAPQQPTTQQAAAGRPSGAHSSGEARSLMPWT